MPRIIVDVMPKPEILDPQGKAITSVLEKLGHTGLEVRQGKRFEITVAEITDARLDEVRQAAAEVLSNAVIENATVRVEDAR